MSMLPPEVLENKFRKIERLFDILSVSSFEAIKLFMLFIIFISAIMYILISTNISKFSVLLVNAITKGFYLLLLCLMITVTIKVCFFILRKITENNRKRKEFISEQIKSKEKEDARARQASRKSR